MPETNQKLPSQSWLGTAGVIFVMIILLFVFIAVAPTARKDSQQNLRTANQYTYSARQSSWRYRRSTANIRETCMRKGVIWARGLGYTGPLLHQKAAMYTSKCIQDQSDFLQSILGEVLNTPTYYA